MDDQLLWQCSLYTAIAAMYAGVGIYAIGTSSRSSQWLSFCFLLTYLENVVAFPAALCGYARHAWILGQFATTRYLVMVLVAMSFSLLTLAVCARRMRLPRILADLPAVVVPRA